MGEATRAQKRSATTQSAIMRKVANGTATGEERAFIRAGKRNTRILTGQDDLSTWDDEELKWGRRRDKNGQLRGRPSKIVPKALHDELVKRTLARANQLMVQNTEKAVQALIDVIEGQDTEDKDRITAAKLIMDRVLGKAPDKVELKTDSPWQLALGAAIVSIKSEDILGTPEGEEEDDDDE